jgi:type I restriction enzyme R subunit
MNEKQMSEQDIRSKFITPAKVGSGWDLQSQIREEVAFTQGRVLVRGKLVARGKAKRADYILYHKPNIPLAIIEAKDNNHPVGGGMQQALEYGVCWMSHSYIVLMETPFWNMISPNQKEKLKMNSH